VDIKHGSRARPAAEERWPEEMGGASKLADDDERALEAIRRQLDIDFRRPSGGEPAARHARWDAGADEDAPRKRTSNRTRLVGTVAGILLLLACAAGGAIAASVIMLYLKSGDVTATADRPAPRSSPESAGPGRAAQAPGSSSPAPPPEVVLPSRPKPMPRRVLTPPETHHRTPLGDVERNAPPPSERERVRERTTSAP